MPPVRGTKREAIRVEPELWREYGLACEADKTNRSVDLRAHMQRKVRAWRRKSKGAPAALALFRAQTRKRRAGGPTVKKKADLAHSALSRSVLILPHRPCTGSARQQGVTRVACGLSAAECFRKRIVTADLPGLKAGKDGWWSMQCPGRSHGKPVRFCVGKYCHIYWTDLGGCPDSEVLAGLVKLGFPSASLWQPTGLKAKSSSEGENRLAGTILDIAFGEGSATERLIRMTLLAADGEMPEGPMVELFAANLRVSPASIYRATAEDQARGPEVAGVPFGGPFGNRAFPGGRGVNPEVVGPAGFASSGAGQRPCPIRTGEKTGLSDSQQ